MVVMLCFAVLLPQWPVSNVVKTTLTSSGQQTFDYTTKGVSGRTLKFEMVDGDDGFSVFGSVYNSVRSYFVHEDYVLEYYQSEKRASSELMMTSNTTDSKQVDNVTVDWIRS
jgi:hypothetical protein